jgi:transcriptional regulator GlxA family with amidase domain
MPMQAAVLIFPGAEELDVFGPYEVLAAADELGADIHTALVSVESTDPIVLGKGTTVQPHRRYAAGPPADLFIIPGGGWANHAPTGVRTEVENPATLQLLRDVHATGATLAAVCTGTMLMLRAGLLQNIPATTHHSAIEELRADGIAVPSARVVDAGSIVTSGGVTSGLDLALWLVERFAGKEVAAKTQCYLEYERRGEVWQQPR